MENGTMWLGAPWRRLPLALGALMLFAGASVAQTHQHHDRGVPGVSVDEAVKELSSTDPVKRLQAVKALGAVNDDGKATEYLIKAAGDSDVRVRAKAVQVLGDIRCTDATPALVQYLLLRTTDADMKRLIIVSLGKIGDTRTVRPLIELLRQDLDAATRGTAIYALGEIGSLEAVDALEHIAQTDEDQTVRRVASEAASKIQGRSSLGTGTGK